MEEFPWLGLMLFVVVAFPGIGTWAGAIITCIIDMSIWIVVSAHKFASEQ